MGVGPAILALYSAWGLLQQRGATIELGAQVLVCQHHRQAVKELCASCGLKLSSQETSTLAKGAPVRDLFTRLHIPYACIDLSGEHAALQWDLNVIACPTEHRQQYHLVTNHGTSEHILNQYNVFKIMHDLTAVDGFILHAVPFLRYINHGYFSYHPNLFIALAQVNGYQLHGLWVNIDARFTHCIPWEPQLDEYLPRGDTLLIALLQKRQDQLFVPPSQAVIPTPIPLLRRMLASFRKEVA